MNQLNRFGIAAAVAAAMSLVSLHAAQYGGAPAAPPHAVLPSRNRTSRRRARAGGHPDLTGMWGGGGGGGAAKPDEKGNLTVLQRGRPCSTAAVRRGQLRAGHQLRARLGRHPAHGSRDSDG